MFKITRKDGKTILKVGRRNYAEITENKNPDYKFCLWLNTGICLSGFDTEQKAIERAERMQNDWNEMIKQVTA